MSSQYGELRPQRMRSVWLFGTPKQISTGFSSWLRYCTAFEQWAPAKLCSIEQRALPSTYNRQGGHHVGHWPTFYFFWHLFCHWMPVNHYVLYSCGSLFFMIITILALLTALCDWKIKKRVPYLKIFFDTQVKNCILDLIMWRLIQSIASYGRPME